MDGRMNLLLALAVAMAAVGNAPSLAQDDSGNEIGVLPDPVQAAVDDTPPREIDGQPIARGPIHEAFAEPLQFTPQPTEAISKQPPAPIDELPPEIDGDQSDFEWISGYWAWDKQRDDYVWVSGVWRRAPVGREWQPGRWEEQDGRYRWTSGAWLSADSAADDLRPTPPATLEEGPTSPAPSDDHFWVPGVWQERDGEYVWRPGFWTKSHDNWVWTPDHYEWTPAGCRFVKGYWDYPWERRGTLYAPCTFASTDLTGRVCYRPSRVISTDQWLASLWIGPGYGQYYYGDYYDYVGIGYSPWYRYSGFSRHYYDPFYSYYHRVFPLTYGIGLYSYFDGLHRHYRGHAHLRPSINFYRTKDWRFSRGYASLYGNVSDLYRYRSRGDRYRLDRNRFQSSLDRGRNGRGYGRDESDRLRDQARRANLDQLRERTNRDSGIRNPMGRSAIVDRGRTTVNPLDRRNSPRAGLSTDRLRNPRADAGNRARQLLEQNRVRSQIAGQRGTNRGTPNVNRALQNRDQRTVGRSGNVGPPAITQSRPRAGIGQSSRVSGSRSAPSVIRSRPSVTRSPPAVSRARANARAAGVGNRAAVGSRAGGGRAAVGSRGGGGGRGNGAARGNAGGGGRGKGGRGR